MASERKKTWVARFVDTRDDRELIIRARKRLMKLEDESYADWLYFDNPAGNLRAMLAMDGEVVAGQYVVVPLNFWLDGEKVTGTLSLDTVTHEDYRNQGIFTGLAEALFSRINDQGIQFTIGFPNENSRPGFLGKLHFEQPCSFHGFYRPVVPMPDWAIGLRRSVTRLPFLGRIETTDCPDEAWLEGMWAKEREQKSATMLKDAKFVRWRYAQNPAQNYRFMTMSRRNGDPVGYVVWNEKSEPAPIGLSTSLMDVVASDPLSAHVLLSAWIEEVRGRATLLKAYATIPTLESAILMASGFIPYGRKTFIARDHSSNQEMRRRLLRKWPISKVYSDVF